MSTKAFESLTIRPNEIVIEFRTQLEDDVEVSLSDEDCMRFLQARKGNVPKAMEMARNWYQWYNQEIIPGFEMTPKDFSLAIYDDPKESVYSEFMPHANLGVGRDGHPVFWEKSGLITAKLSEVKKRLIEDDLFIRHLRQQELMVRRMEKISRRIGKSIEKQIIVLDLKDLSFSLDMTLMKVFRRNLSVDEAFYPERLKVCFLINAPFTFTATWAMIKPWLDPVTAEKTQILGADYKSKLLEYIDEDQIPVEYGGTRQNFAWAWPLNYEE